MKFFDTHKSVNYSNVMLMLLGIALLASLAKASSQWYMAPGVDTTEADQDPCQPYCADNVKSLLQSIVNGSCREMGDITADFLAFAQKLYQFCTQEVCIPADNFSNCIDARHENSMYGLSLLAKAAGVCKK